MKRNNCYSAIILAGGLGTRLREIVADVPKPMAKIDERPFLEYQLEFLRESGFRSVILATGYKAAVIERHFGQFWGDIDIHYSREEEPLGTGGGMLKAMRLLQGCPKVVLVLNGDTFFPVNLKKMLKQHEDKDAGVTIAVMNNDEEGRYSAFGADPSGRLQSNASAGLPVKSGGIYAFSGYVIEELVGRKIEKLSFEDQITPELMNKGVPFYGYREQAPFIDIGVPEDYVRANAIIKNYLKIKHNKN